MRTFSPGSNTDPRAVTTRRRMLQQGATQALLLGPSLALSVAALALFSVDVYAAWGLLFSLGTAAVVLDFGAFQLAQIKRAEGKLAIREMFALFAQASIAPLSLLFLTAVLWNDFLDLFVSGADVESWELPALLGLGAVAKAWQNVSNGIALGADHESARRRAAYISSLAQMLGLAVAVVFTSIYLLSASFLVGALVGLAALGNELRAAIGPPPARHGVSNVGLRGVISALGLTMTQLDRLVVGVVASPAGLAAYDFASRWVATAKLGCILLATGATAQGARAVDTNSDDYRRAAQKFIDKFATAAFIATPLGVGFLTSIVRPQLAFEAFGLSAMLAIGNGLHATTAPVSGYLSGLRMLAPELKYLSISAMTVVPLGFLLGDRFGTYGVAVAVTISLLLGSAYFRYYAAPLALRAMALGK